MKFVKPFNKIEKQFFYNYVKIFIIEFLLAIVLLFIGDMIVDNYVNKSFYNPDNIMDLIDEKGFDSLANFKLPSNVYVEKLNENYRVLKSKNSPHNTGYVYTIDERLDFDSSITIAFYECEDTLTNFVDRGIYIVKSPWADKLLIINHIYNALTIVFLVICVLITTIFLTKSNAKSFIVPIKELLKGINEFKNKNYEYKIDFVCNNELDDLKDTFNDLSTNLNNESILRKTAEKNKEQLILDITHDIKTPLTNISGYCDIMKNNNLDPITQNNYIDVIISNSNRINSLVHSLHEVSYINQQSLNKTSVDICETLRQLIIEYIPILEAVPMDYAIDIPDLSIFCDIDLPKFIRAISNIINNSIKYSGPNTSLLISIVPTLSEVKIIIKDTGVGMNVDLTKSAFEPFVRGDEARSSHVEGSGIGLSIAKKLIEMHSGSLSLDSAPDMGCTITIFLPLINDINSGY